MIEDIYKKVIKAYDRLHGLVHHTALIKSHSLSELIDGEVFLKCENEQYTGSFKARGSLNKMLSLTEDQRTKGFITASTGNHALGFSRALEITGSHGTVYLPEHASATKLKALSHYPVELVQYGSNSLSTELHAKKISTEKDKIWMSPYNDYEVLSGQGTIGVEIAQELPDVDYLLATVGGGGLISGVGAYMKRAIPNIQIIGCQPANSPEMTLSLKAGHIVDLPEYIETLSDGSAGGIEPDAITFEICKEVIDDSILVDEEGIKYGIRYIFQNHKKVIEGAAGVAVSALINNPERFKGKSVVIVLCGANIDTSNFSQIISQT